MTLTVEHEHIRRNIPANQTSLEEKANGGAYIIFINWSNVI